MTYTLFTLSEREALGYLIAYLLREDHPILEIKKENGLFKVKAEGCIYDVYPTFIEQSENYDYEIIES
ncbi:hypothetical protein V9L05_17795 [Bernardetia sp. Wsw4-3y2]|uniref:hypothetical protein n=1 Tax=Bernardetia sp. Wsw4-3y2 TaxID=3127471 RepID=UPI0030CDF531